MCLVCDSSRDVPHVTPAAGAIPWPCWLPPAVFCLAVSPSPVLQVKSGPTHLFPRAFSDASFVYSSFLSLIFNESITNYSRMTSVMSISRLSAPWGCRSLLTSTYSPGCRAGVTQWQWQCPFPSRYVRLCEVVDHVFPLLKRSHSSDFPCSDTFSNFTFWREPLPPFENQDIHSASA